MAPLPPIGDFHHFFGSQPASSSVEPTLCRCVCCCCTLPHSIAVVGRVFFARLEHPPSMQVDFFIFRPQVNLLAHRGGGCSTGVAGGAAAAAGWPCWATPPLKCDHLAFPSWCDIYSVHVVGMHTCHSMHTWHIAFKLACCTPHTQVACVIAWLHVIGCGVWCRCMRPGIVS